MHKELKNIAADVAFCKHHIIHNETLAVLKFVTSGNKSYHSTNLAGLCIAVQFLKGDCRQTKYSRIMNKQSLFLYSGNLALLIYYAFFVLFGIVLMNRKKSKSGYAIYLTLSK